MPDRFLNLLSTLNTRDIGGYPTRDGHSTRWRRFLRSDSLHRLSEVDVELLQAAGLDAIIDLRRSDEAAAEPDRTAGFPAVHYYNLPVLPSAVSSAAPGNPLAGVRSLSDVYIAMFDHFQANLRVIFETITAHANAPMIIHCTAGKDRTGVVFVLLLDLAGVDDETIIADYALTKGRIEPMLTRLRANALTAGLDLARHETMLLCEPELMQVALAHLRDKYGDAANYLRTIGLSDAQIETIREATRE